MYIHNPTSAIVYRFICLFTCFFGLFFNVMPFTASRILHMLSYFTILTNILCLIVYIYCILISTKSLLTGKLAHYSDTVIYYKGLATLSAIVSCVVYNFVLQSEDVTHTMRGIMVIGRNDLFVHYLVPFLTVGDWLMFQPKGMFKWRYCISWLIYPLIYLFVMMPVTHISNDYPYFFMNISENGWNTFLSVLLFMAVLCIVTGTAIVACDNIVDYIFPTNYSCRHTKK